MARLYAAARLFVNFFQPSFKLASKQRIGARVVKNYHAPATPCERLLSSESISENVKHKLRQVAATLDPLKLLDEIRTMQKHLAELSAGETPTVLSGRNPELDSFLKSLSRAWQDGEIRPTHRQRPKAARDYRTRLDPFEYAWPLLCRWLDQAPDITATDLLARLQSHEPGIYADGLKRTLQRRVHEWRISRSRQLILAQPTKDAESTPDLAGATW